MPLVLALAILLLVASGTWRVVAPGRALDAERKKAMRQHPEREAVGSPETDRRWRMQIQLGGLARIAMAAVIMWALGMQFGVSPKPMSRVGDELETLILDAAEKYVRKGETAGLAIAVVAGEKERIVTLGVPKVNAREGISADTLFEIGSITKVFTGIALATEIERGAAKLDDPISRHLPEGLKIADAAGQVTLRQLTTHTSGFPRSPSGMSFLGLVHYLFLGGDPYSSYDKARFEKAVATVKLKSNPGMEYSNFGVSLLGWALAHKNGMNVEAFLRDRVLAPLGMTDSGMTLREAQTARFAQGYRSVTKVGPLLIAFKSSEWLLADHLTAAGGIRASINDMKKFLRANMQPDGSKLAGPVRTSHEGLFKVNDRRSVAMNWLRDGDGKETPVILWHNGGTGGFRSYMGFYEDGSAGVVVLSNTSTEVDSLGIDLLKRLRESSKPRQKTARVAP